MSSVEGGGQAQVCVSLEHEAPAMAGRAEPAALLAAPEGERDPQPAVERSQGARRRRRQECDAGR
jgi:hypothetical protein